MEMARAAERAMRARGANGLPRWTLPKDSAIKVVPLSIPAEEERERSAERAEILRFLAHTLLRLPLSLSLLFSGEQKKGSEEELGQNLFSAFWPARSFCHRPRVECIKGNPPRKVEGDDEGCRLRGPFLSVPPPAATFFREEPRPC